MVRCRLTCPVRSAQRQHYNSSEAYCARTIDQVTGLRLQRVDVYRNWFAQGVGFQPTFETLSRNALSNLSCRLHAGGQTGVSSYRMQSLHVSAQ